MNSAPSASAVVIKPWYREPWPWILMAGPFVAMIGCIITIYLAYTQFVDKPVEGVVKRGMMIEQVAPHSAEAAKPPGVGAVKVNP